MPQFKEIPSPADPVRVRLDLTEEEARQLRALAARGGLALAAVCRIAMGLVARGFTVTPDGILAEAERIRSGMRTKKPEPQPKRPVGRPRKPRPADEKGAGQ